MTGDGGPERGRGLPGVLDTGHYNCCLSQNLAVSAVMQLFPKAGHGPHPRLLGQTSHCSAPEAGLGSVDVQHLLKCVCSVVSNSLRPHGL